jgi:hypothetical protein
MSFRPYCVSLLFFDFFRRDRRLVGDLGGGFFDDRSLGLEHHGHEATFHRRSLFHDIEALELDEDPLENLLADFGMGEFPSAESDRHFDLEAILEEGPDVLLLEIQVVSRDLGLHPDFLQLAYADLLPRFLYLFFLFELEFTVVQQLAYRRYRLRRDFDKVETEVACHLDGFGRRNDALLLALIVYEPHFADTDLFIDP